MKTARLEAFTDGVLAIVITITVLEMKVPHEATVAGLREVGPMLFAYALSFVNVGLYWANHHHLLHAAEKVDGRVLWANNVMLFWLSLVPWVIRWMDESGFASMPIAAYGVILGCAGIGYNWLQRELIRLDGRDSAIYRALRIDWKGKLSVVAYGVAIPLAFVSPWAAIVLYAIVSISWLIPDRRIEKVLTGDQTSRVPARASSNSIRP